MNKRWMSAVCAALTAGFLGLSEKDAFGQTTVSVIGGNSPFIISTSTLNGPLDNYVVSANGELRITGGTFTNEGEISTLFDLSHPGVVNLNSPAVLNNTGEVISNGGFNTTGTFNNQIGGHVSGSFVFQSGGSFVNEAANNLMGAGGTTFLSGSSFTNASGAGFTLGNASPGQIGGVVRIGGAGVNHGTITIQNGANFNVQSTGQFTNSASGILELQDHGLSGVFEVDGSFNNDGTINVADGELRIDSGGIATGSGGISVTGAGVLNVRGSLTQDTIDVQDGVLRGAGTISANTLTIGPNAEVQPGNSPGVLTVHGDLNLEGDYSFEYGRLIGSFPVASFDELIVSGTATLGNDVDLSLSFLFDPEVGDSFDVLQAQTINGDFNSITVIPPTGGFQDALMFQARKLVDVNGSEDVIRITVVPEPASAMMLAALGVALAAVRGRAGGGRGRDESRR